VDQGRRRQDQNAGAPAPGSTARRPRCPECKQPLPVDLDPRAACRPFCSDRCKLIDLGRWLGGEHAIAGEPAIVPDDDEG
jgi:endogenous inhibitor of DNA gyrase (YacG/DUF329 family)